jgi:hypothetical protein
MFVISNECQCDGPVCEPCETETHLISTDFVESLLKNTSYLYIGAFVLFPLLLPKKSFKYNEKRKGS